MPWPRKWKNGYVCVCLASAAHWGGWQAGRVIDVFSLGTLIRHVLHVLGMASPFICTLNPLWCSGSKEENSCGLGKADFPLKSRCGTTVRIFFFFCQKIFKRLFSYLIDSWTSCPSIQCWFNTCHMPGIVADAQESSLCERCSLRVSLWSRRVKDQML